jgi:hypothetical protein
MGRICRLAFQRGEAAELVGILRGMLDDEDY